MAEIDSGALSFKAIMDNNQLNKAIEETLKRIQGLSDGSVAGGKQMDAAFKKTASDINESFRQIDKMADIHKIALKELEAEYKQLGQAAGAAFKSGNDKEYRSLTAKQNAIKGEITVRKQLLQEVGKQADALAESERKMEDVKKKTESASNAHVSFRTQLRNAREELIRMEQAGQRNTDAYARLQQRLGQLQDAMDDASTQARVLANDEAKFQGVISGLSGIAGGFSAATGAISLFAGENENLQKIMVKVQSLMAITIGLQQVAQALNKDSAFRLVTVNNLKAWWNKITERSVITQSAETAAISTNVAVHRSLTSEIIKNSTIVGVNTVATHASTAAQITGTTATKGLASGFRILGNAIKSIPGIGWILAAVSGLIALYKHFADKVKKAKEEHEEMAKKVAEGCYEAIGSIMQLSQSYSSLGNNMKAKEKFIDDNKEKFNKLGISINSVYDAERLLSNPKHVQSFINAQVAKAKAAALIATSNEKIKRMIEIDQLTSGMSDIVTMTVGGGNYGGGGTVIQADNAQKKKLLKERQELNNGIKKDIAQTIEYEKEGAEQLKQAGIETGKKYKEGSIGALEEAISAKRAKLKELTDVKERNNLLKEISVMEKQLDSMSGKSEKKKSEKKEKDPYLERLEKLKGEYNRFMKWINSGDEIIVKAAGKEFSGLLKQGATYIDYLKRQREIIEKIDISKRTQTQNNQLRTINNQIAEETKKTVLESFNKELSDQLENAKTVIEMLNIIEQRRNDLKNDGTEIDNSKKESLDDAEKNTLKKQKEESDALLEEYSSYLDKRTKMHEKYLNDIALLEKRLEKSSTPEEKKTVEKAIANRTRQYEKDKEGTGDTDYDQLVKDYASFEQKKQAIINEYNEKRKKADEHNNTQLVEELNKAQSKALSALASDELKKDVDWEKMFGNLDELTTKKLDELLQKFNNTSIFLGVELSPEDLKIVKDKVEQVKRELNQRNPFKAIGAGLKEFSKATDDTQKKAALTKTMQGAADAAGLLKGGFDAVVGGLKDMGLVGDDITQQLLSDIGEMVGAAGQLAQGIASGNPLGIIQGAIGLLTSAFKVFDKKSRDAERLVRKHAEELERLKIAYEKLSDAIDKALGGDKYKQQQAIIENLREQQKKLQQMIDAEQSKRKKKVDDNKIKEWQNQINEIDKQISDSINNIRESILGSDIKSLISGIGDSFFEAFGKGENAAESLRKKVKDVVRDIAKQMILQKILEEPMGRIVEKWAKTWVDDKGNFKGHDAVLNTLAQLSNELVTYGERIAPTLQSAYDSISKALGAQDVDKSLTGAIKGITEDQASMLAGQTNAMRLNQQEMIQVQRQVLLALYDIVRNTSYNRFLESIDRKLDYLKTDNLRGQGLS